MWRVLLLWRRFRKEITLVWAMLKNPAAPFFAKLLAVAAAVYVVSPIDLVPDFPILGWLDDGIVAFVLLKLSLKFLPKDLYNSLSAQIDQRASMKR